MSREPINNGVHRHLNHRNNGTPWIPHRWQTPAEGLLALPSARVTDRKPEEHGAGHCPPPSSRRGRPAAGSRACAPGRRCTALGWGNGRVPTRCAPRTTPLGLSFLFCQVGDSLPGDRTGGCREAGGRCTPPALCKMVAAVFAFAAPPPPAGRPSDQAGRARGRAAGGKQA